MPRENPPFFSGFLSVEAGVFHYQCSEHSTSKCVAACIVVNFLFSHFIARCCSEVKTVFERAIQRQNGWASTHSGKSDDSAANNLRRTAVVFMDEAGLPEEAKESLKVLHYYLDDPSVAFVAISNRPLDAAKMNR